MMNNQIPSCSAAFKRQLRVAITAIPSVMHTVHFSACIAHIYAAKYTLHGEERSLRMLILVRVIDVMCDIRSKEFSGDVHCALGHGYWHSAIWHVHKASVTTALCRQMLGSLAFHYSCNGRLRIKLCI